MVSAAAGATGSVAGQIAKIAGARVVGIAGGPHKCKAVVEDFGFDACIDYKEADLRAALKEHCPKGVNVYFDNVGGPILDAVLGRLAPKARVVLCGVISSYLTGEHPGPANYVNLLAKTALMQGFNALDEWGRFDEAFASLRQWEADGRLVHRQTIFDGIESCVDALNGLFTGANIGKTLVKISEPTPPLMPKLSAGLLLYRVADGVVEVLIGHPGGPFWARKDEGAWSIPKGEYRRGRRPVDRRATGIPRGTRQAAAGRSAHRLRAIEAAEREGHHRLRRSRRPGPRRHLQQHVRAGVAEGFGQHPRVSRNRPRRLVFRGRGQ